MPRTATTVRAGATQAPAPTPRDDIDALIRSFERHLLAEGKSRQTVRVYTYAARALELFLRQRGMPVAVANITREHVETYFVSTRERLSPSSRNQQFRSLQAFWKYLRQEDEVTDSPLRNLARPSIPDVPPPIITPEQMQTLLRSCSGPSFVNRRDTAILSLFYDSGIRRGEMAGIQLTDLDLDGLAVLVTGKGDKQRIARFGVAASRHIDRYLRKRAEHPFTTSPALWVGERGGLGISGIEQIVQRRGAEAGLRIHCHTFRHTAAHQLLSSGYAEGDAMYQFGWKARAMVDRYGRSAGAERARSHFDQHSPLDKLNRR